jgi:small subunit ribosomal protein S16
LAVRIRLARVGATKRPSYRVVAIDSRRPRDGRSLEILGFYDPLTEPATVQLHADRIRDWIGRGATPSETVVKLLHQAGLDPRGAEEAASEPKAAAKPKPRARKAAAAAGAKASA